MLQRYRPDDPSFLAELEARLRGSLAQTQIRSGELCSITLAVPEIPCSGLVAQLPEMFFWSRPAAEREMLGLGVAAKVETSGKGSWQQLKQAFDSWRAGWRHWDPDGTGLRPLAQGGFAFSNRDGARLAVPSLLLRREGDTCALTFSFRALDGRVDVAPSLSYLRHLLAAMGRKGRVPQPSILERLESSPDRDAWLERVGRAVRDIHRGELDKVVLSRRVRVRAAQDFDPALVMDGLAQRYGGCALFAVGGDEDGVFLGASPEVLARLEGGEAYSDALAGTVWSEGEGSRRLLGDVKNGREHRLVVQAVAEALRPLCASLEVPAAPQILKLGSLRHLWSSLRGRVKPGIGLLDLAQRLHPTPAVGGYPRQAALDWLERHGESRGDWYTGALGWVDTAEEGEFAVALRCARVAGNEAELYGGAGIVAGSEPEQELAETEAKLGALLTVLEQSGSSRD